MNARATYYLTKQPLPGGAAFENFEFREPFAAGQPGLAGTTVIFGITKKTPKELGF